MARIRSIKPEFWSDEKTGTLSDRATKVFIGMWNFSDDCAVLEFNLAEIKARIYPHSPLSPEELILKPLVEEVLPRRLAVIFGYSTGGIPESSGNPAPDIKPYLFIRNFPKHQYIKNPSKPTIPGWKKGATPESFGCYLPALSGNVPVALREDGGIPPGGIWKWNWNWKGNGKGNGSGREGSGEGKPDSPTGADAGGGVPGAPPPAAPPAAAGSKGNGAGEGNFIDGALKQNDLTPEQQRAVDELLEIHRRAPLNGEKLSEKLLKLDLTPLQIMKWTSHFLKTARRTQEEAPE
jgi:hypothetical protein